MWKVIQVATGKELTVVKDVKKAGIRGVVPLENRNIRKNGEWKKQPYVLFAGYVFLDMDYNAENYYKVKKIPSVIRFLEGTLTRLEIEEILLLSSGGSGNPLEPSIVRDIGERLEVLTGVLKRFPSNRLSFNKRQRKVTVQMSLQNETKNITLGFQMENDSAPDEKPMENCNTENQEAE